MIPKERYWQCPKCHKEYKARANAYFKLTFRGYETHPSCKDCQCHLIIRSKRIAD